MRLLFIFIVSTFSTTYQIDKYYSQDLSCSKQETSWAITEVASCTPTTSCQNLNGLTGHQTTCQTVAPTVPTGWATFVAYQDLNCALVPTIMSVPADGCTGYWIGATVALLCSSQVGTVVDCQQNSQTCGGCSFKSANKNGTCTRGNPTLSYTMSSYKFNCPSVTTRATTITATSSSTQTTRPSCAIKLTTATVVAIFIVASLI